MAVTANHCGSEIAVIGFALRLPGAATHASFWDNLCAGRETIYDLESAELTAAGVPAELLAHPNYVRRKPLLTGVAPLEKIDSKLFRFSPLEARLTGPEQRLLLECAWEALDCAAIGVTPPEVRGGVFVSVDLSRYLLTYLVPSLTPYTSAAVRELAMFGNDRDHTALRIAHRLALTGPAFALGSTCSSSLLAVHQACQSLLHHECDYALAGGASVEIPHQVGYLFVEGGLSSPDGRCCAYDAAAKGTVFGSGAGLVVLARQKDAEAEGHQIFATIRGSAVNNDGAGKQSYRAPSVDGQAAVIAEALAIADVSASDLGVIEGQGTATRLGDAVEVAALTKAFAGQDRGASSCALGSVKTNIGHAGGAAGIAALLKGILMVWHGRVPPSLHFSKPNPQGNMLSSPFFVPTAETAWPKRDGPRICGVSAFGIGGTNVHLVVAEGKARPHREVLPGPHVLTWSGATPAALDAQRAELARHIATTPNLNLADLAWTLHIGRRHLALRDGLVCGDREQALALLQDPEARAANRQTHEKLGRWLRGESVTGLTPRGVRLCGPTTRFVREHHWLEPPTATFPPPPTRSPNPSEVLLEAARFVLGVSGEELTLDTDLVAWGIESFLAAELLAAVHERLGIVIPLNLFYELRTIVALASHLEQTEPIALAPPCFEFIWVDDRDELVQVHSRLADLPPTELGVFEPLFDDGKLLALDHFVERWRAGELVVICARRPQEAEIAGLYLLDRRPRLTYLNARGLGLLELPYVSYSYLAPESRGRLNAALLDRWFNDELSRCWPTPSFDIVNSVRLKTGVYIKHARVLAAAVARHGADEENLFERLYTQNFTARAELSRLNESPQAIGRLLALMREQDYGDLSGRELLALVDSSPAEIFSGLAQLIRADALARLRDVQRRLTRGELFFAGYELRWLEPLFVWRPVR